VKTICKYYSRGVKRQSQKRWIPLIKPYRYGIIICMKKTFNIDAKLLKQAREACGASTATDTIRLGLEALVRRAAGERMIAYFGSESDALQHEVPRRREEPAKPARKRRPE
jgi:hypothetical protein